MILAIDVGTAWARAAFLDRDGRPHLATLADGTMALPVFARQTVSGLEIGRPARRGQAGNSETTVAYLTRLMGRPELVPNRLRQNLPFGIREYEGEVICDLLYAEESIGRLYGQLVRTLVDEVEATTERRSTAVVLTVPASADERYRLQAKQAVERQQIAVTRLLNQPAAALRAAPIDEQMQRLAIVNCGGSAIEVSIAERRDRGWQITATAGDLSMGADDLLWRVAEGIRERLLHINGVDVAQVGFSSAALWGLRHAAGEAVAHLSHAPKTKVVIDHGGGFGRDLATVVRRQDLDAWMAADLTHARSLCQRALQQAEVSAQNLDQIMLIGEWANLPPLRDAITGQFERPVLVLSPEAAACLAVRGAAMATAEAAPLIWDVTPYALGINCFYGDRELFSPIIPANTPIPTAQAGSGGAWTEFYRTRFPDQSEVTLRILQYRGARAPDPYGAMPVTPVECEVLGEWTFSGLQPLSRRHADFAVNFAIGEEGILHLMACETRTGHVLSASVDRTIG